MPQSHIKLHKDNSLLTPSNSQFTEHLRARRYKRWFLSQVTTGRSQFSCALIIKTRFKPPALYSNPLTAAPELSTEIDKTERRDGAATFPTRMMCV